MSETTTAALEAAREALQKRITEYLSQGGLFNPEAMNHEAVRDLLIDCRATLAHQEQRAEPVAWQFRYRRSADRRPGEWIDIDQITFEGASTNPEKFEVRALIVAPQLSKD